MGLQWQKTLCLLFCSRSGIFSPIMPHYRRRLYRPVLVETVTIRRLQGQTSRLSFVALSIEQTIASLYDDRVAQQLKTSIKTPPSEKRLLECPPRIALSGCTWCFNDSRYASWPRPKTRKVCWMDVGVCYNTVCTVLWEREKQKSPGTFSQVLAQALMENHSRGWERNSFTLFKSICSLCWTLAPECRHVLPKISITALLRIKNLKNIIFAWV